MKRTILLTMIALTAILLPYTLKAQELGTWDNPYDTSNVHLLNLRVQVNDDPTEFRWAKDSWRGEDKKDHLLGGIATMSLSSIIFDTDTDDQVLTLAAYNVGFWFAWELKDAVWPWEDHGWWGGEGFSGKDFAWSAAGVGFITGFVLLLK